MLDFDTAETQLASAPNQCLFTEPDFNLRPLDLTDQREHVLRRQRIAVRHSEADERARISRKATSESAIERIRRSCGANATHLAGAGDSLLVIRPTTHPPGNLTSGMGHF